MPGKLKLSIEITYDDLKTATNACYQAGLIAWERNYSHTAKGRLETAYRLSAHAGDPALRQSIQQALTRLTDDSDAQGTLP